jgi:hypothetical protein
MGILPFPGFQPTRWMVAHDHRRGSSRLHRLIAPERRPPAQSSKARLGTAGRFGHRLPVWSDAGWQPAGWGAQAARPRFAWFGNAREHSRTAPLAGLDLRSGSAGWQPAVSPTGSRQGVEVGKTSELYTARRLPTCDTADKLSAPRGWCHAAPPNSTAPKRRLVFGGQPCNLGCASSLTAGARRRRSTAICRKELL